MPKPIAPLLTTTDWNAEWKQLQEARDHYDSPQAWDEKAKTFPSKHGSQTPYVRRFLELAGVKPHESVLDMGCGTGALATPLAQNGNEVIACDFSRGMLRAMVADQRSLGVSGVTTHLMSWEDDWEAFDLGEDAVDVALASRSIATYDLQESLLKLDRVAKRRACITLPCGPSPKIDDRLLMAAGIQNRVGRDFLYAFNILASHGIAPEVAYIPSSRVEAFESPQEALDQYTRIVTNASERFATEDELAAIPDRLARWLDTALVEDAQGFHLAEPRRVTWAFIAWETR